jgi:hypothetical protein
MIHPEDIHIANLKLLLICFEKMSGLPINFHKSAVMVLEPNALEEQRIANMLNCEQRTSPSLTVP